MSKDNVINPDIAKKLLRADLANLAKKVNANKPLTKGERELLQSAMDAESKPSDDLFVTNQVALAEALKVDRKTIQRWKKAHKELSKQPYTFSNGRYHVSSWKKWKREKAGTTSDDNLSPSQLKARQVLLQNEKLAVQIGIIKKEYVLASDVEKWGADMVISAKKILLAIPTTLAPQIVGLSVPEAEARLKEEINSALEQLHTQDWR